MLFETRSCIFEYISQSKKKHQVLTNLCRGTINLSDILTSIYKIYVRKMKTV